MAKNDKQAADKPASSGTVFDRVLAGSVRESAQQIWLAGMGAFAKAQEEGSKVFDALVSDGVTLQRKTQAAAEEKIDEVTSRVTSMAGEVGSKAGQQWDKLESIFEDRVARSLGRLGVPTATEMADLRAQIDALSAELGRLARRSGSMAKPAATSRPAAPAEKAAPQTPARQRSTVKRGSATSAE